MRWRSATVAALLFAPIVGGIASAVIFEVYWASVRDSYVIAATPVLAMYGVVIVAALTSTLGLFWHALACRFRWRSLGAYIFAGGLFGAVISATVRITMVERTSIAELMFLLFWLMATGVITAGTAWLIRRPDRDPPNPPTSSP